MNVNQVVNTPKKSNNIAIIIGVTVLVCCLFSLYLTFMRSRDDGKEIERPVEEKPSSPGPIPADLLDLLKTNSEDGTGLQFNNPLKIDIYDNCDCTHLRQRIQAKDATSGEINLASIGEEVHPRCVKAEGSVYMNGYKHLAKGKGDDGEPWEDRKVIDEVFMMDKPDGMPNVLKVKIGCEENQKNIEDVALKFKWWRIPKSI